MTRFLAILAAATLACAAPAIAATPDTVINVRTGDLDLATQPGRTALHHRVLVAANRLCTADSGSRPFDLMADCVNQVTADAAPQIAQAFARAQPAGTPASTQVASR